MMIDHTFEEWNPCVVGYVPTGVTNVLEACGPQIVNENIKLIRWTLGAESICVESLSWNSANGPVDFDFDFAPACPKAALFGAQAMWDQNVSEWSKTLQNHHSTASTTPSRSSQKQWACVVIDGATKRTSRADNQSIDCTQSQQSIESTQVNPNARRRAQCTGGGGKEKRYVHQKMQNPVQPTSISQRTSKK